MKKWMVLIVSSFLSLSVMACHDITTTLPLSSLTSTTSSLTQSIDVTHVDVSAFATNNSLELANIMTNISPWNTGSKTPITLTINDLIEYQPWGGTGAALTYSSAWLINNSVDRDEIIEYIFGNDGMAVQLVRLCIGASDFVTPSMGHYTYNDTYGNVTDMELTQFSIAKDQVIIDIIKDALIINPNLIFMAAPWSAPAWMKTTNSLYGGALKPLYYDVYAEYLIKFIEAYAAEGITIHYLSVQNEPYYASNEYPGMLWSIDNTRRFVGEFLGPKMDTKEMTTKIMIWDHNPVDNFGNLINFPISVLSNETAAQYIDAIGVHCYTGNDNDMYNYLDYLRQGAPHIEVFMTECTAVTTYRNRESNIEWSVRRMYTEAYNRFARGTTYWNLVMDPQGNTHLGGCSNCTGALTVPANGSSGYALEADGFVISHFSKYIKIGAKRISVSSSHTSLVSTGFKDEQGKITLVVFNDGPERTVTILWRDHYFLMKLPANSLTSIYWYLPNSNLT
jgi:glucosylceramidase